jgi:hypothetical protein
MTTDQTYDPWDDAASAEAPPLYYYGQISMDTWPCVLVKGQGKVPFDAEQHRVEDRRTAIELIITPLADQRASFTLQRSIIAQSPEWYRYIWPSLKALGLTNPKEAIDKWCKCEQVGTGRTYRNSAGEEREARTVKFLALYDTEAECREAFHADTGRAHDDEGDDVTESHPATGGGNGTANDAQRQTARAFIETLAKQHKGDLAAIRKAVVNIPMITQHYPPESEDFAQVVTETLQQ